MEAKQVLVWRHDLKVRKGKIAAQIAHASLGAVLSCVNYHEDDTEENFMEIDLRNYPPLKDWIKGIFTKVCVYCNNEEELLDLYRQAQEANLICKLITDAGLTEFNGVPTNTCIAIGPGYVEDIDKITKHLPLL